ncbi:MAG: ABC transporter permease [Phycisphaerae bacterium]|nr:ABC transporter permease [Phycisphaerae bacterium]
MDTLSNSEPMSGAVDVPVRVIDPPHGWIPVNWRELWYYRELLYFLTWRDVAVRYKQTVLGVLWAILQPFVKLVVFSVVFGRMARMDSEGFPYPIFLYAGLLPWQFFSEALTRSSQSVVVGAHMVQKVYFPRLIIPVASVGGCLVDFAISFVLLVGLMFYYGVTPGLGFFMVVPLVALTVIAALGAGILLSALSVAYRDVRYVVPFVTQVWMFLTPVIYPVRLVPSRWQWLLSLNPMSGIVDAYRSAVLGKPFAWVNLAVSAGVAVVVFAIALRYFRKLEVRFADVV